MICKQLELPINATVPVTIADILSGNVARVKSGGAIVMKVKVTGFLLNSTLIADVLNRGDSIVLNLEKGTLYAMEGSREVEHLVTMLRFCPAPNQV